MLLILCSFFYNDTATSEIYTLSLHDALPISARRAVNSSATDRCAYIRLAAVHASPMFRILARTAPSTALSRSEEHTSELQSRRDLVCRLLLEKKKNNKQIKCSTNVNSLRCFL